MSWDALASKTYCDKIFVTTTTTGWAEAIHSYLGLMKILTPLGVLQYQNISLGTCI